jgi:mRNA-degrading endonuclease toxin of MazEF toxin-antitoxin module
MARTTVPATAPAAPGRSRVASRPASFHPDVVIGDESTRVLCEMVGAVDARKLGQHVGHLTLDEMRGIDDALLLVLGLR